MKISRAGKQTRAYWRAEAKVAERWKTETMPCYPINTPFQVAMQRVQGFATGWIAGVAWVKRQQRKKR